MIRGKKNKKGFSLIETLVASAILSGAVLTLGAISSMSLSATRLNRQYEVAVSLIDKQLNLIDYVGIDEFIELGQLEGVFEGYEPTYHWQVVTEYQDIDSLYLVTITVSWLDGKRPYSISVDTMLDGVSVYLEVELE
jgi:prepilin-type N-terminal cleavage/methylation domain-containing protein